MAPSSLVTTGTRKTLTSQQRERKRANNRQAQKAMRARTKEHIDRLEHELEGRDWTIQELLQRNKTLEDELSRLKENMGVSMTSSPYPTPVYDDSPRALPSPSGDYSSLSDHSQKYVPLPNNCEPWANTVPVPSNVSSPSSSANTDEYGPGYIPTSAVGGHKDIKMEYEDVDHHDAALRLANQSMQGASNPYIQQQQHQHQHQQPAWNMYPAVYYPQAQSLVH